MSVGRPDLARAFAAAPGDHEAAFPRRRWPPWAAQIALNGGLVSGWREHRTSSRPPGARLAMPVTRTGRPGSAPDHHRPAALGRLLVLRPTGCHSQLGLSIIFESPGWWGYPRRTAAAFPPGRARSASSGTIHAEVLTSVAPLTARGPVLSKRGFRLLPASAYPDEFPRPPGRPAPPGGHRRAPGCGRGNCRRPTSFPGVGPHGRHVLLPPTSTHRAGPRAGLPPTLPRLATTAPNPSPPRRLHEHPRMRRFGPLLTPLWDKSQRPTPAPPAPPSPPHPPTHPGHSTQPRLAPPRAVS